MRGRRTRTPQVAWQVLLEEMRSQNAATIDAVQAVERSTKEHFVRLDEKIETRFAIVEAAIRDLRDRVDAAGHELGGRVTALERRR